uniref:Cyclin N-terminal domain containing 1 n=1 Tax=Naja naja TaxID=35670 RepID=A0A8C7DXY6_NAJNA
INPVRTARPSLVRYSEPIFGVVTPEIIQDTFLHMAMENERYLSELCGEAGCFKDTQIVEFVFLLAGKWSLTESATYQAVEIFERYILKLLEEFSNLTLGKEEDSSWASLKAQMEDTYMLRLVSCIQLASKFSFHYKIVNNKMVLKFLKSLGFSYTTEELLESELAILKALHFQVNVPVPLAYVEVLLEVLGKPRRRILKKLALIPICLSLLSVAEQAKFVSVKEDLMLLAVGVIGASSFLLNHEDWNQVVEYLNSTTGISLLSITEAVYAILKNSLGLGSTVDGC